MIKMITRKKNLPCKSAFRISLIRGVLSAVFVLFLSALPVFSAPYAPSDVITVFDRLYESDLVIYGKIIQKSGTKTQGHTEVEVYEVIKGQGWKKGDFFYINQLLDQKDKAVGVFYFTKVYTEGRDLLNFNAFYPDKNKDMYSYSKKIKEFFDKNDHKGRIAYLFSNVNNSNSFISWDAFCQLGLMSYEDLKAAAPQIDRHSLRYLISTGKTPSNRKSFFCFLLGLAGNRDDFGLITRVIENPAHKDSDILPGAYMAYGLLSNNPGELYLQKAKAGISQKTNEAVLEAVRNLMKYERPADPAPLMKPFYHLLLYGNKESVVLALDIARDLKLSGPIKHMRDLYGKHSYDKQVKQSIIIYLKFVRNNPDASRLMRSLKEQEQDPEIKKLFDS